MDLSIGDKVVFPAHGIGIITRLEELAFDGQSVRFYVLKILHDGSTLKVAVDKATDRGMREVVNQAQINDIYEVLNDHTVPEKRETWNRRYRQYLEKIQTGEPKKIASVLRDLAVHKAVQMLSFGERKVYDQVHRLVIQELSVARDVSEDTIKKELEAIFKIETP